MKIEQDWLLSIQNTDNDNLTNKSPYELIINVKMEIDEFKLIEPFTQTVIRCA